MKYLAALILGAGLVVTLCNASCSVKLPPQLEEGQTLNGCERNGKLYELGSKWRDKDCLECRCSLNGVLTCCINVKKPSDYDPERCFFEFDKEACKYKLIPNEDPEKQCLYYATVG